MVSRNPPWADLPQELLSTIANFLTSNPIPILTFRSICRSWRSSCPPLSNSPLLSHLLPLTIPSTSYHSFDDSSSSSILSVTIIYALRRPLYLSEGQVSSLSPDAWILFVDEFTPGKLSIRKPFSNGSYSIPLNFPKNINLIDLNVIELGRFHNFSYSTVSTYYIEDRVLSKLGFCVTDDNKVVMFPNASAAIILREDGILGLYRLDAGIIECEIKHDGKGFRFDDIVKYKGRVLGIDRRGRVYEIKYHSSELIPFVAPIVGGGGRRKRLVESLERLYLVVRCKEKFGKSDKGPKFKVYELNEERKKWCEISSLGDRSFCFGRNFSFSASVQELVTCGNNCILFTKHSFLSYSWNDDDYKDFPKFKKHDLDVGVYHLHNADDFGAIGSYRGYSDTLWPPPCWIWPIDRLKRMEIVETVIDEILDRIPDNFKVEVKRAGDGPCDDFGKPDVMEFVRNILKLKKMVIEFQEEENEFMNELREAIDDLNQMDNLTFELARTRNRGTAEGKLGWPDILKKSQATHDHVLRSIKGMLRLHDALLLYLEEWATLLEMSMNSQVAPMLNLTK